MIKRDIFVCYCHSLEHQYAIWYDEELNQVYIQPHLYNGGVNWVHRFWNRVKYVFGYTSGFGAWDEIIINPTDAVELIEVLKKITPPEIDNIADRGRD